MNDCIWSVGRGRKSNLRKEKVGKARICRQEAEMDLT